VNLSNKGNTLTLNIDGEKISETQSKGIRGAIETADNVRDEVAKTIKRRKREAKRKLRQAKAKDQD